MATTLDYPRRAVPVTKTTPPLQNGDRLSRLEFEKRYHAMPNLKRAELIEGVVYMPSPVSYMSHGKPNSEVIMWLGYYKAITDGIGVGDNSTLRLDMDNEPQPDAVALIDPAMGGQARISDDGYIEGAPELVVEIASSSVSIDMHKKFDVYRRSGVLEYVVWKVQENEIVWFELDNGLFVLKSPEADGLLHSRALPGLVLDSMALLQDDLLKLHSDQMKQRDSEAHSQFVAKLALSRDHRS